MTPLTPEQRGLVDRHQPLVRNFVAKRVRLFPHLESLSEDMFQEGMLALCRSVTRYEPSRGAAFATFVRMYLETYIRNFERAACNPVHAPPRNRRNNTPAVYIKRGDMPTQDPGYDADPSDDLDASALYARAREHMSAVSNPRAAAVFLRVAFDEPDGPVPLPRANRPRINPNRGPSCTVVAQELGISRSAVQQMTARARKKFNLWAESIRNEAA